SQPAADPRRVAAHLVPDLRAAAGDRDVVAAGRAAAAAPVRGAALRPGAPRQLADPADDRRALPARLRSAAAVRRDGQELDQGAGPVARRRTRIEPALSSKPIGQTYRLTIRHVPAQGRAAASALSFGYPHPP